MRLRISALLGLLVSVTLCLALLTPAHAARPIEDYAPYSAPGKCHPKPYAGTAYLAGWVVRRYGGAPLGMSRACGKKRGATSEHQTGRAFDWALDVRNPRQRRIAHTFLHDLFARDAAGNEDARARRMGIVYVIWNDHIYESWDGFAPQPYLNSGCKTRKKCSTTLRHRDHIHVSLGSAGARGRTSFYDTRLTQRS